MPPTDSEDDLLDLPPSSKLVYTVLAKNGPLTQQGIAKESYLSPRTVRYALKELEEINVVNEEISLQDARQHVYHISSDNQEQP